MELLSGKDSYLLDNPINVLLIITALETGGLEVYIMNVLRSIDREKFKVTIVCTGRNTNWYQDELNALNVQTVFCPSSYLQIPYISRLKKLIKNLHTDVICDFRGDFAGPSLMAGKMCGVKSRIAMYRSTRSGFKPSVSKNLYSAAMHRLTKNYASKIAGNTRQVLSSFYPEQPYSSLFEVIHNGIDLDDFSPGHSGNNIRKELGIPENSIVIGNVGRFHEAKNHPVLLEVFSRVNRENSNTHLLLVGYGVLEKKIRELIEHYGISRSVTLAGKQKDIPRMLAAMDIFFYPSIYEGMPNSLIEAMACGLPIVASNIPEISEIIPKDLHKQLFNSFNLESFEVELNRLINNTSERKVIAEKCREHAVKNFDIKVSAQKLCNLWMANLP